MRRPFADERPIRPFATLDKSLTNAEFMGESLRKQVAEMFESIPEWAKESESFVDWMLSNDKDRLLDLSQATRNQSVEKAFSVCYNGENISLTDTDSGVETTTPTVPCGENSIRLSDVHTHPVGEQAFPSLSDLGAVDGPTTGIPLHFNTLIIRPERNSGTVEARGTCFNTHSFDARWKVRQIYNEWRENDNLEKAQRMIREELIPEYGTKFKLEQ